ncbi:hypothetical protein K9N68_00955 [Kovacikia minuta CCNUW1]|uniref:hypothetical protein n=1 Tax=Kovacikia minuta TaxID=2931930 RepID=UPI001CCE615D|nr:hypothetical protein [Kovacikia minuta]UBF26614.1 hypothetical protein K9N68_00955 [Kovacikia minuta CCNUW1]
MNRISKQLFNEEMMANQLSSTALLKLWFGWVVANTIGGAIGSWLGETVFNIDPNSVVSFLLLAALISVSISLCQGIFLTRKVPKVRWWIIVSSIASTLCIALSPYILILSALAIGSRGGESLCFGIFGIFSGFVVGLAQWLFVLRKFPDSGRWILFSCLGSAIGLTVGNAVAISLTDSILSFDSPMNGLVSMGAIARLLNGVITGIPLVQLLQSQTQHNLSN